MESQLGKQIGGRYAVTELIGSGNATVTYRARDLRNDRKVALKILRARGENAANLQLEKARTIATLQHPKIVALYDAGIDDDVAYVASEFAEGVTLRDLAGAPLSYHGVLGYMVDILEGLEYAHEHGIVHRNLQPSNVMISADGTTARLTDFALWQKTLDVPLTTRTGQVAGTVAYLAPEQFFEEPGDARSDLYAVGVMMYEAFTGMLPFQEDRDDFVATIFSHMQDVPPPPREVNADIPEPLERVIVRAIDRDPRARYQSAGELIVDLHYLLSPLGGAYPATLTSARAQGSTPPTGAFDFVSGPNRGRALDAVLRGMIATRRRHYRQAREAYLEALTELCADGSDVEYAKAALKYGTMLLQKASDGLRERSELRDGVTRLNDALRIFQQLELNDQYAEAESLINALERTAVGHT